MNPLEHLRHTTTLNGLAMMTAEQFDALERRVGEERTARLALAQAQRGYVDNEDRLLRQCCQERWIETMAATKKLGDRISELRHRGFWSRLNWLLTGR